MFCNELWVTIRNICNKLRVYINLIVVKKTERGYKYCLIPLICSDSINMKWK